MFWYKVCLKWGAGEDTRKGSLLPTNNMDNKLVNWFLELIQEMLRNQARSKSKDISVFHRAPLQREAGLGRSWDNCCPLGKHSPGGLRNSHPSQGPIILILLSQSCSHSCLVSFSVSTRSQKKEYSFPVIQSPSPNPSSSRKHSEVTLSYPGYSHWLPRTGQLVFDQLPSTPGHMGGGFHAMILQNTG